MNLSFIEIHPNQHLQSRTGHTSRFLAPPMTVTTAKEAKPENSQALLPDALRPELFKPPQ